MSSLTTRQYKDIDLAFGRNPITGDVAKKADNNAIKQSLKNIIMTELYTSPFHPDFGSKLYRLLFEPFSTLTSVAIQMEIETSIANFEPRVRVSSVSVDEIPEKNSVSISIKYTTLNSTLPQTLTFAVYRAR